MFPRKLRIDVTCPFRSCRNCPSDGRKVIQTIFSTSEYTTDAASQLAATMNEFHRKLWCLLHFLQFLIEPILFELLYLHFKLSPGFHSFFIKYLGKLRSDFKETYKQALFENSAQNAPVKESTKRSVHSQSGMSNFSFCSIGIR